MESNGLESDEVMTAGDRGGDGSRPAVVVGNHRPGSPVPFLNSSTEKTRFLDLELRTVRRNVSPPIGIAGKDRDSPIWQSGR